MVPHLNFMKTLFEKLLDYYEIDTKEYRLMQSEDENSLPNFNVFPKINEIVEYFKEAVKLKKKILIYGDYDCDGIMSTSIIMNLFLKEGYKPGFYIPSRENDGYGLTKDNVKRFYELGYDIILCVDNGITLVEEIDLANSLGMECVIFDHHTIQEKLPNAKYILHPSLSSIGEYNISAGEVCFYFSWAYLEKIDKYLLTLAGVSTVSDMMVVKSYNRVIIKLALKYLNEEHFASLYNLIDKKYEIISEDNLGLEIAPKINSIGRLLNDNTRFNIVKYFLPDDGNNNARLNWINNINKERKQLISEYSQDVEIDETFDSIVTIINKNEGLAGLIANSLLNKYEKPVVVFSTTNDDGILKGSARSKSGFNIVKAFTSLSDLLITFGGHECAGGLSIDKKNFVEFQNKFNELAKIYKFEEQEKKLISLSLNEFTINDYNLYRSFGPFGEGHQKPLFVIKNFPTIGFTPSKDGKHIFSTLSSSGKFVYFNYKHDILYHREVNLIGELTRNSFNGNVYVQFMIKDFQ